MVTISEVVKILEEKANEVEPTDSIWSRGYRDGIRVSAAILKGALDDIQQAGYEGLGEA